MVAIPLNNLCLASKQKGGEYILIYYSTASALTDIKNKKGDYVMKSEAKHTSHISRSVILIIVLMAGFTPLSYAEKSEDRISVEGVKQETEEFIEALKGYTAKQRDQAIEKTKDAINTLDKRIDSLENRVDKNWDKMDKAVRENARASLRELRKQRNQLAQWYGSMKTSSADAWEQMKKGFSEAYRSLSDSWEKAVKEFVEDN